MRTSSHMPSAASIHRRRTVVMVMFISIVFVVVFLSVGGGITNRETSTRDSRDVSEGSQYIYGQRKPAHLQEPLLIETQSRVRKPSAPPSHRRHSVTKTASSSSSSTAISPPSSSSSSSPSSSSSLALASRYTEEALADIAKGMVSEYQQSAREYTEILKAIVAKAPCKLLVYGVGKDSSTYARLNREGEEEGVEEDGKKKKARSLFIEHDTSWIQQVREKDPSLEILPVTYTTTVGTSLRSGFSTTFETGAGALEEWDIIIVDAPPGEIEKNPGREAPIREASLAAKRRQRQQQQQQPQQQEEGGVVGLDGIRKVKQQHVDVFVHDVNREIEAKSSDKYLTSDSSSYVSYDRTRHYVFGGEPPRMPK